MMEVCSCLYMVLLINKIHEHNLIYFFFEFMTFL